MTDEFEIEGLFRTANKIVFFLHAIQTTLENIDSIECGVRANASLYWSRLLPLLNDIVEFIFNNLVLCYNLQLKTGWREGGLGALRHDVKCHLTELLLDRIILPFQNLVVSTPLSSKLVAV